MRRFTIYGETDVEVICFFLDVQSVTVYLGHATVYRSFLAGFTSWYITDESSEEWNPWKYVQEGNRLQRGCVAGLPRVIYQTNCPILSCKSNYTVFDINTMRTQSLV